MTARVPWHRLAVRVPWHRLLLPGLIALAFAALASIVLAHGHPYGLDTGPHRWSDAHRPHAAATAARIVTDCGTGVFPPLAAALGGWLAGAAAAGEDASRGAARFRAGIPTALLALIALLVGQSLRTGLMAALHRARPPAADWAVHAAGLLAWGILRMRPRAGGRVIAALCGLVAVAVGCTRVYLGVHWPTDVLGGWLFAGFWLAAVLPPLTWYADGPGERTGPGDGTDPDGRNEADGPDGSDERDGPGDQTDTP